MFKMSAVFGLVWALSACEQEFDTCTGGDNMSNPRIADGFDPASENPQLRLLWDRGTGKGANLSSAYFDSVRVSNMGMSRALVVSVEHVATREIAIRLTPALAQHLEQDKELSFTLSFPDRRAGIDCVHRGSADEYYVHITLSLRDGELAGSTITQSMHLGDI